jgi:hypothetical protein
MTVSIEDTAAEVIQLFEGIGSINSPEALGTLGTGTLSLPDPTVHAVTTVTISANTTFTMPPVAAGKKVQVQITQDGTGSRTGTWAMHAGDGGAIKWVGGAHTLSTTAGHEDLATLTCLDGTNWVGLLQLAIA